LLYTNYSKIQQKFTNFLLTSRYTVIQRDRQTHTQTDIQTHSHTERQADTHTQTYRHTDRQRDRQTDIPQVEEQYCVIKLYSVALRVKPVFSLYP